MLLVLKEPSFVIVGRFGVASESKAPSPSLNVSKRQAGKISKPGLLHEIQTYVVIDKNCTTTSYVRYGTVLLTVDCSYYCNDAYGEAESFSTSPWSQLPVPVLASY